MEVEAVPGSDIRNIRDAFSRIMLYSMNTSAISIFTFSSHRRMQQTNFRFRSACPYEDSAACAYRCIAEQPAGLGPPAEVLTR